uniref:MAT1-2-1 n=1 Tax=Monilinia fructicola TaxID=38448 RepID=A0A2U8RNR7_MONFR|nr:MAT1-2-1 [Monilinia fructicola]
MSLQQLVQLGEWVPHQGTVLETPLADVPYPPLKTTPVGAYGISGLTEEIYNAMCNFFVELDEFSAFDLNPSAVMLDTEYFRIGNPERQILLHLFEQHTGHRGVYVRDAWDSKILLAPLEMFKDKPMLVIAGYTNLCLEPLNIEEQRKSNGSWDAPCSTPGDDDVAPCSTPTDKHLSPPSLPAALKPKIPRPANEWILYRADNHLPIKKAYPGITNNEISSIIAGMWAAETPERRLKYKIRADVLKEAHKKAYPSYKYTPRKPSEKKRRASKKTLNKPTTTFCNPRTNNTSGNLGLETFGLNATINHTNMSEQSVEPEESRLSYADETTGMNFTQTESWQMVQQQDLFTFFAARQ